MRADRLLSILLLLQSKGRMTAHDLALQLEVSERTIYRDLEALGIAGVPVYTERGPGGGCELVNGYQTKLTGLTEFEVRALFLAHLTVPLADLGLDQALDQAMLKLSATLPAPSRDNAEQMRQRIHFDASWWYHGEMSIDCLQIIQEAVWQDRKLELLYLEDDSAQSELLIEAYGLVAKAGVWYLVGSETCLVRVLRVSRIQRAIALEERFQRPTHFDLASFWSEYCVRVEANPSHYAASLRLAPEDALRIHETLSAWGYRLVENEEYLSIQEESAQKQPVRNNFPHPGRFRQQKKETRISVHTRPFVHSKEKKAYTSYKKKPFAQKKKGLYCSTKKSLLPTYKKNNFYSFDTPTSSSLRLAPLIQSPFPL